MANDSCPGCLKEYAGGYCHGCLRKLFGGRKVDPVLPISRSEYDRTKMRQGDRVSIPGTQSKHPMKLSGRWLELTDRDGEYFLKPAPRGAYARVAEVPANEHATMQVARQVFGIDTAGNALVFFRDGEPAYLTKRFDRDALGGKSPQEDFAQLSQRTEATHGRSYKYGFSYEGIADLLRRYVGPYPIEAEKFFARLAFNSMVRNGDAHLRDFSLIRAPGQNIHVLAPAYDLINTRLHLPDGKDMALSLFKDGYVSEAFRAGGFHSRADFLLFAKRIGIREERAETLLGKLTDRFAAVQALIGRSYLSADAQDEYLGHVRTGLARLSRPCPPR